MTLLCRYCVRRGCHVDERAKTLSEVGAGIEVARMLRVPASVRPRGAL